nr:hypothetical protein [Tanacetum cinerariifolium]
SGSPAWRSRAESANYRDTAGLAAALLYKPPRAGFRARYKGFATGRGSPAPVVALRVQAGLKAVGSSQKKAGFIILIIRLVQRFGLGLRGIDVGQKGFVVAGVAHAGGHHFPPSAEAQQEVGHRVLRVAPPQRVELLVGLGKLEVVEVLHGPAQLQLNVFVEQQPARNIHGRGGHTHTVEGYLPGRGSRRRCLRPCPKAAA